MKEQVGAPAVVASGQGQAAIAEALRAFGAQEARHTPWMKAGDLAHAVDAPDATDPQFQSDVQALYTAGVIRLMSGGTAGGASFFEAMLVPPAESTKPAEESAP